MVNTAELKQIFPLRVNTLRHVVDGDGRYPRAMTPSAVGPTNYAIWYLHEKWSVIAGSCISEVFFTNMVYP